MKVFVGRSQSLWVVNSEKGKVRKLPFSLSSLIGAALASIGAASLCLSIIIHADLDFNPLSFFDGIKHAFVASPPISQDSEKLHSIIGRLQQEKDEARRLNSRLESKLQSLEGALSTAAGDVFANSSKKEKNGATYKPAVFTGFSLPFDQRRTLKKIDSLVMQLKRLPIKAPVANPVINSTYGARISPNGIGSSFHHGIDFSLKDSLNVMATGNGVIQTVGSMRGYGLYIDIIHRAGVVTRYAHLSRSLVKEGQRVSSGQLIAQGGSSGTATGLHLHYEVIINGRSRDPMLFLRLPQKLEYALKSDPDSIKGKFLNATADRNLSQLFAFTG